MKKYTVDEPEFNKTLIITETTDTGHADNINKAPKMAFENTLYLEKTKLDADGGDVSEAVIKTADEIGDEEYPIPAAGDKPRTFLGKTIKFLGNIKDWMTGVCLLGQIVNNCVTDNAKLPLSAAQGAELMRLYNVLNTNQKNTDAKVPVITYSELETTKKTKITLAKPGGVLFLAHRGGTEIDTNGAVYMIKNNGKRSIVILNQSGTFKVETGDGCVYVTSANTYWAYMYVAQ